MAESGKASFTDLFEPKTPGFIKVPFNDADAVKHAIDEQTVAIMLEPIQGEAGVIPASQSFIQSLKQLTEKHNLLLIFDEVQTGIGRTGELFAYQGYAIEPDIMTLGKGLGGGVPVAALLTTAEKSVFNYGDQGGTYNGNPLMTAVANTVINQVRDDEFLQNINTASNYLHKQLMALSTQFSLGEVRGKGLLLALSTKQLNATTIAHKCLETGLLINAPRENCLRLMPALNVSKQEIDLMIKHLGICIHSMQKKIPWLKRIF
jgi:acetylornithine/N-succinyldiaminopimelate aminotransferase